MRQDHHSQWAEGERASPRSYQFVGGQPAATATGQLVSLRPASMADVEMFYEWRIDASDLHLWAASRRIPSPEEFAPEFQNNFLGNITFVVCRKADGVPVGFVQGYSMNLEHGWGFILVKIDRRYRSPGIAVEATYLLLRYLFQNFNIRKLYAEVFEYNTMSLRLLEKIGFREEGMFKEHVWFNDRYWHMVRLALYRNAWKIEPEQLERMLAKRSRGPQ